VSRDKPPTAFGAQLTTGSALRVAAARPGRGGFVWAPVGGRPVRWSFTELLIAAERVAHALATEIPPGQALGVQAFSSDAWLVVQHAAALAGIRLVALPPALPRRPSAAIASRTGTVRVLREAGLARLLSTESNPIPFQTLRTPRSRRCSSHLAPAPSRDASSCRTPR
jgi:acyl-CoA synthetase (AMP-forming)/AMP-acid ligase II